MPFIKWTVEPVFLSRQPIPPDKNVTDELEATTNVTLVGILRQLACLVSVADCVFSEIGAECKVLYERSERLWDKVQRCEKTVLELNAKAVPVPVGDLTKFSQLKTHHKTKYDQESSLFTPETRPTRVRCLYERATARPPLHVIRCLEGDEAYSDVDSRCLYLCMPIWGDAAKRRLKVDLDIEARKPASILVSTEAKNSSQDNAVRERSPEEGLPSPEEKMRALSSEYPPVVVPIDTSEHNFNRLSSVRRSLIHVDFLIKRKKHHKRRNTISDGNCKELEQALSSSRKSGNVIKTEALIHTSCQTDDDLLVMTEKRRSKRRSEGSPSSGDLSSSSTENAKSEKRSSFYEAMNFKLGRDWKFLKKSSKKEDHSSKADSEKTKEKAENSSTSDKKRRSFLPISTSSSAMTVAVKLRENSARTGGKGHEDGQSSSGNWSASSSTRASVDSDQHQCAVSPDAMPHSQSDSSLGKDSLFSDHTHHDTDGRSHDDTFTGYMSDASAALTATTLASSWKPGPLPRREESRSNTHSTDQDSQSGTLTPEAYHSDSKSSSSPGLRKVSIGSDPFPSALDDGDSSVYSVDTDGYYTSMHTDSGLKYGKAGGEAEGNFHATGDRGSQTSIDTIGNLSLNSFLSQNADATNDTGSISSTLTLVKAKVPPAPPPRMSSTRKLSPVLSQKESSSPPCAGDISESDCEVVERLRNKTAISSFRYPSICAVSPVPSEEEWWKADSEKKISKEGSHTADSGQRHAEGTVEHNQDQRRGSECCSVKKGELQKDTMADSEKEDSPPRYNMYGIQSPRKMLFLNAVVPQKSTSARVESPPVLESFSPASESEPCSPSHPRPGTSAPQSPSQLPKSSAVTCSSSAVISEESESTMRNTMAHTSTTGRSKNNAQIIPALTTGEYQDPSKEGGQHRKATEETHLTASEVAAKPLPETAAATSHSVSPGATPDSGPHTPSVAPSVPSCLPSSSSYMPLYLNRPTSLMSKARSPFLSYLERKSPSPAKSSTPSPPSPARSPCIKSSLLSPVQASTSANHKNRGSLSSPESSLKSSPESSPKSSPQATTPPAVPPPPPPLTYDSSVLERGSARLPSVTNEANSIFGHPPCFSRSGARVTLDAEGKVIYSSNSLGRQHESSPVTYFTESIVSASALPSDHKYATLPYSLSPIQASNPHAYVKLDPSGKVESYSSSTLPRTRHSTPVEKSSPLRSSPPRPARVTPSVTPYKPQPGSSNSTPSSPSRAYVSLPHQQQQETKLSGRMTPQFVPGYSMNGRNSGMTTPVRRPASVAPLYPSRTLSTPVSQPPSSGRSTPVHHFTPISVPSSASGYGRHTPQHHVVSPQQPISSAWSSGLPQQPSATSLPKAGYAIRHSYSTSSVPQAFDGRTTPVQRYTPQCDPYIAKAPSPPRNYHLHHSSSTNSISSQSSGRVTPTYSVQYTAHDTWAPYRKGREGIVQEPAHMYTHVGRTDVLPALAVVQTNTTAKSYNVPNSATSGRAATLQTARQSPVHQQQRLPSMADNMTKYLHGKDCTFLSHSASDLPLYGQPPTAHTQNNNLKQRQASWGPQHRPQSISSIPMSAASGKTWSPPPYEEAAQKSRYIDPNRTKNNSSTPGGSPQHLPSNAQPQQQPPGQIRSPSHNSGVGMHLEFQGDQGPPTATLRNHHTYCDIRSPTGAYMQGGQCPPGTKGADTDLIKPSPPCMQSISLGKQGNPDRRIYSTSEHKAPNSGFDNEAPILRNKQSNSINGRNGAPSADAHNTQSPLSPDSTGRRPEAPECTMMLSSTSISSSESDKSPDNTGTSTPLGQEPRQRPMSTEDLFAAIHSSKKRHGIKIDSDIVSPLSSRSSSPSVGRPGTPSKGGLAETGFLSPRGPRDRSSWSGDVGASSPTHRRSLANDRLGPPKPTSLLEFKKLLLQTKTTSKNGQERKSAVELLKAASQAKKLVEETVNSLPSSPVSVASPMDQSWTSVVPPKRVGRVRSSLQYRYDHMCPPILEDCLEELPEVKSGIFRETNGVDRLENAPNEQKRPPSSSTWV